MQPFEQKLQAYFHLVKDGWAIFHIPDKQFMPDTYNFLTQYSPRGNRSIKGNTFKVKLPGMPLAYLDKARQVQIPLIDLVGQMVEITVQVKHYSFMTKGKKIYGWNMSLVEAHPL